MAENLLNFVDFDQKSIKVLDKEKDEKDKKLLTEEDRERLKVLIAKKFGQKEESKYIIDKPIPVDKAIPTDESLRPYEIQVDSLSEIDKTRQEPEGNLVDAFGIAYHETSGYLWKALPFEYTQELGQRIIEKGYQKYETPKQWQKTLADVTMGLFPSAAASISPAVGVPVAITGALAKAVLPYYVAQSMGMGRVRVEEARKRGKEISPLKEEFVVIGYGATTYVTERLMLKHFLGLTKGVARTVGAKRTAEALTGYMSKNVNPAQFASKSSLAKIGYLIANKQKKQAAYEILKILPRQFHYSGKAEMFQEISEGRIHNLIDRFYDEERDIWEGTINDAVFGYLGGGLISATTTGILSVRPSIQRQAANLIDAENTYFAHEQFVQERIQQIETMSRKDLMENARKYGLWIGQKPEALRKQLIEIETNPNLTESEEIKHRHYLVKDMRDYANAHGYKFTDVFAADANPEIRKKFVNEYMKSEEHLKFKKEQHKQINEFAPVVTPEEIAFNEAMMEYRESPTFQRVIERQTEYQNHVKSFNENVDIAEYLDKKKQLYDAFVQEQLLMLQDPEYKKIARIGEIASAAKKAQRSAEVSEFYFHGTPNFRGDIFTDIYSAYNGLIFLTADESFARFWTADRPKSEIIKTRVKNLKAFNPFIEKDDEVIVDLLDIYVNMYQDILPVSFKPDIKILQETGYEFWETSQVKNYLEKAGYNAIWISERAGGQKVNLAVFDPSIIEIVQRDVPSSSMPLESINNLIDVINPAFGEKAPKIEFDSDLFKQVLKENELLHQYTETGEPILIHGFYDAETNTVYINPETANETTILHEYLHPVVNAVAKSDPTLYSALIDAIKDTDYYKESNAYKDPVVRADEALVQAIADKGAQIYDKKAKSKFKVALRKLALKLKQILLKLLPNSEWVKKTNLNSFIEYLSVAIQAENAVQKLMSDFDMQNSRAKGLQYLLVSDPQRLSKEVKENRIEAERMYNAGRNPFDIWLQTGWYYDEAFNDFFYELHSHKTLAKSTKLLESVSAKLNFNAIKQGKLKTISIEDIMDVTPYVEAYPELKNLKVTFKYLSTSKIKALYNHPTLKEPVGRIVINLKFFEKHFKNLKTGFNANNFFSATILSTVEHEVQHAVQWLDFYTKEYIDYNKSILSSAQAGIDIFEHFESENLRYIFARTFPQYKLKKDITSTDLTKIFANPNIITEYADGPKVDIEKLNTAVEEILYLHNPLEVQARLAGNRLANRLILGEAAPNIKDDIDLKTIRDEEFLVYEPAALTTDELSSKAEYAQIIQTKETLSKEGTDIAELAHRDLKEDNVELNSLQLSVFNNYMQKVYEGHARKVVSKSNLKELLQHDLDFLQYFANAKGSIYSSENINYIDGSEKSLRKFQNEANGVESMALTMLDRIRHKIFGRIDTDSLYLGLGRPVATALKVFPSIRAAVEKNAQRLVTELYAEFPNTMNRERRRHLEQLALHVANNEAEKQHEDYKRLTETERQVVDNVANKIRDYFKSSYELLNQRGILNREFHVRMADALDYHADRLAAKDPDNPEVEMMRKQAEFVRENMHYAHIPYHMLFSLDLFDPTAIKKLQYFTKVKRNTLTYRDLFEPIELEDGTLQESICKTENLTIGNVIGSYARRMGKDLALSNLLSIAEEQGLIRDAEKSYMHTEYITPPPAAKHLLHDKVIHQELARWLTDSLLTGYKPNMFMKALTVSKLATFIHPTFLPLYDVVQGVILGSTTSPKMLINLPKAIRSVVLNDTEYQEAVMNGLESKPISNVFVSYLRELQIKGYSQSVRIGKAKIPIPLAGNVLHWLNGFSKITGLNKESFKQAGYQITAPLTGIYSLLFDAAWGMDSIMRMNSYYYLRGKGYNSMEAAQTAALYHGDYAAVPAKTRHMLNYALYTPTFKLVMGKMYAKLAKDILVIEDDADLTNNIRAMEGIGRLFALLAAQSMLLISLGFKEKEWGRRYTKRVKDVTGKPQEFNLIISHPGNMFSKYVSRFLQARDQIYEEPVINFLKANRWELNPLYRTLYDIYISNYDPIKKKQIVHEAETYEYKTYKRVEYAIKTLLPILDNPFIEIPGIDTMSKEEVLTYVENLDNRTVQHLELLFELPFSFAYIKDPQEFEILKEINFLTNRIKQKLPIEHRKFETMDDAKAREYLKELERARRRQIENDIKKLKERIRRLQQLQRNKKGSQ